MKKSASWIAIVIAGTGLVILSALGLPAQSSAPAQKSDAELTADQQKQLDQLAQLEEQLQRSRRALRNAIAEYGWDSEEADEAEERFLRDRAEYRKLRRALRAAGVPLPPSAGVGGGLRGGWPGRWTGRAHRGAHGCHHCGHCGCRCGGW